MIINSTNNIFNGTNWIKMNKSELNLGNPNGMSDLFK